MLTAEKTVNNVCKKSPSQMFDRVLDISTLFLSWQSFRISHSLCKKWSFSLRIFSVKCDQNAVWSHLLKKFLIENFVFCVVILVKIWNLRLQVMRVSRSVSRLLSNISDGVFLWNLCKFEQIVFIILKTFHKIYLRIRTLITSKVLNTNLESFS